MLAYRYPPAWYFSVMDCNVGLNYYTLFHMPEQYVHYTESIEFPLSQQERFRHDYACRHVLWAAGCAP